MFLIGFITFALLYAVQPLLPSLARRYALGSADSALALSVSTGALAFAIWLCAARAAAWDRRRLMLSALLLAALLLSGWQPYDRTTWWLEVAPVLIVLPLLVATRASYPLTPLLYGLIFAHCLVLMLGGAYTYARVPLGDWVQQAFALSRNPYDKLGHFMQGFVPAIAAREMPGLPIREAVQRLQIANNLNSAAISAGASIVIPSY